MSTRKPLEHMTAELLDHIKINWQTVEYNTALIDIVNGNLLPYVQDSMKRELNPRAYNRSKERIPPINILKKLQLKLSKVYGENPERTVGENEIDERLMENYIENWDLNVNLNYVNELLVINKYAALEPYMDNGIPAMRPLSAKDFIVYSDSVVNPNDMTVFIKFMGNTNKEVEIKNNILNGNKKGIKSVALFHAYSDEEFMIFDEEGEVYLLQDNPFGVIPFIYVRTNNNELIPTPDSDNLPMTVLIPKLLADLNYAVMFGCRAQVVAIDVDIDNAEFSPDSIWMVSSAEGDDKSPSIETIKPDVDVEKIIELINTELGLFLDTKGISTASIGKATVGAAASGISKLIDESDASAINRSYKKIFQSVEKRLFKVLPTLHSTWVANNESDELVSFSQDFNPNVKLIDAEIIPDNAKILEELKIEDELGILTKFMALQRLNPDMEDEEIQKILDELELKDILKIELPEEIEETEEAEEAEEAEEE